MICPCPGRLGQHSSPEWLGASESAGRQVPFQGLSNELAAEEPWLPFPEGALKRLIASSPTSRGTEEDGDGAEAPAGVRKAGAGTGFVELSTNTARQPLPGDELHCRLRAVGP